MNRTFGFTSAKGSTDREVFFTRGRILLYAGIFALICLAQNPAEAAVISPKISAGTHHTLALKSDGSLLAWGYNFEGQLSDGTSTNQLSPVVVIDVSGNPVNGIMAIEAGFAYSLALKSDGTVLAWGYNFSGQLGDGTTANRLSPVAVRDASGNPVNGIMAIAADDSFSLALKSDGTVLAWGSNTVGQLGDGTTIDRLNPVAVRDTSGNPVNGIMAIAAGGGHSLALKSDGSVWAWGDNFDGQLGAGAMRNQLNPVVVIDVLGKPVSGIMAIAAGFRYSLALKNDGTLLGWGENIVGSIGDGTTINRSTAVVVKDVAGNAVNGIIAISAGRYHSLALKNDGSLLAWGSNNYGQLGDGTTIDRLNPVAVRDASGNPVREVMAISAGGEYSLALKSDGSVLAWGANYYGQLGDGTTTDQHTAVFVREDDRPINLNVGDIPPLAAAVMLTTMTGALTTWTPLVSDADGDPLTCRLGSAPVNGTATIATNCSLGTYQSHPGFIGTDSFTYLANDGAADSNPGTVTVVVTEDTVDQICVQNNPVSSFTQTGKQGTLTVTFTGNITARTNKEVKVCPGTPLDYQASSTQGPVICKIKNSTTRGSGSLKINDHLKCTDKPAGKDKVHFKVKSGMR